VASLAGFARDVLLAPDIVCRAAAMATSDPAQRWMLLQPRQVRASYVRDVLDVRGGPREQRIWMLRAPDAVRHSYLRHVARATGAGPEVYWMLAQPAAVRESYLREVLGAPPRS
jgi:hypothetical protein